MRQMNLLMKKSAFLYIILASVLWGTSGIFVHFLSSYGFTSLDMTLIRSIVSIFSVGIYIAFTRKSLFKLNAKEILLFAGSGIAFLGTGSCYFYSMQLSSISTAVVLMYTAPIFVMLYSVAFLGEKLTKLKGVAVLCTIIGCGLVSGIVGGLKFDAKGIVFGLLAGISYSAYNIFTKIEMRNKINPLTANFYCFVFAFLAGLLIVNPAGIIKCIAANPPVTIPLSIGMGICTCVLPYLFYTLALRTIPAGTASSMAVLEPMAATIFSVALFGEKLSFESLLGIILILGAVFVLSKE